MIQRRQTLYLLIAIILGVVALFVPVGGSFSDKMGLDAALYNICVRTVGGNYDFSTMYLFLLQAITIPVGIVTIFKYNNRPLQMRLCVINVVLLVLWYAALIAVVTVTDALPEKTTFKPYFSVCLPAVSIILHLMAHHGVKADEKLVRDAYRIR